MSIGFGVFLLLVLVNLLTFFRMGQDKHRAKAGDWRIPEKELLLWCACFGALGGLLGMRAFRHKTRHKKFTVGVPLLLALQCIVVLFALWRGSAGYLPS